MIVELIRYSLSSPVDLSRYYITGPSETDFFWGGGGEMVVIIVRSSLILSYNFVPLNPDNTHIYSELNLTKPRAQEEIRDILKNFFHD